GGHAGGELLARRRRAVHRRELDRRERHVGAEFVEGEREARAQPATRELQGRRRLAVIRVHALEAHGEALLGGGPAGEGEEQERGIANEAAHRVPPVLGSGVTVRRTCWRRVWFSRAMSALRRASCSRSRRLYRRLARAGCAAGFFRL